MATYVKLPFTNYDYVLGYQTINQAIDNLTAVNDALNAQHFVNAQDAFARHDIVKTARDVVVIYGTSTNSTFFNPSNSVPIESGPHIPNAFRGSVAGQYFVPVIGLASFNGEAIAICTSGTPKPLIVCRPDYSNTYGQGPGLFITCYEMGTGAMVPTDFDLTLSVYGTLG